MPSPAFVIANAVNPVLTACLVAAPFLTPCRADPAWRFWSRSAVGVGVAVLLAEAGKRGEIWPHHPSFPSGHETFALAVSTFLIRRDPRWLTVAVPLLPLLAWALVAAHFHHPWDVAGALLTGVPAAWLCDRLLSPRSTPS